MNDRVCQFFVRSLGVQCTLRRLPCEVYTVQQYTTPSSGRKPNREYFSPLQLQSNIFLVQFYNWKPSSSYQTLPSNEVYFFGSEHNQTFICPYVSGQEILKGFLGYRSFEQDLETCPNH